MLLKAGLCLFSLTVCRGFGIHSTTHRSSAVSSPRQSLSFKRYSAPNNPESPEVSDESSGGAKAGQSDAESRSDKLLNLTKSLMTLGFDFERAAKLALEQLGEAPTSSTITPQGRVFL